MKFILDNHECEVTTKPSRERRWEGTSVVEVRTIVQGKPYTYAQRVPDTSLRDTVASIVAGDRANKVCASVARAFERKRKASEEGR